MAYKAPLVFAACAAALLSCSAAAFAQSPSPAPSPSPSAVPDPCGSILSIINRPTIGTGVCTVRAHGFALETGWNNTTITGAGGGNLATYGVSLVRFGTGDPRLDLEVQPPNATRSAVGGQIVNGWSDTALAAKLELGYTDRAVWGVNAEVTLPTGSQAFTAVGPQYIGNFNWGYTVNSVVGLSGTLGFNELRGLNGSGVSQSYFAFVPTFEATASLPGPSELFGEYAYFSQSGVAMGSKSELDFGYVRDIGDHVQADVEFGYTPTIIGGQRQHYVGAGVSFLR